MELWIRSTARTNLLKARFLTIMKGENFYKKNKWESKGYTICNCTEQGNYELLGTYKTKERALEVLDEIQNKIKTLLYLKPKALFKPEDLISAKKYFEELNNLEFITCDKNFEIIPFSSNVVVYEMPKE